MSTLSGVIGLHWNPVRYKCMNSWIYICSWRTCRYILCRRLVWFCRCAMDIPRLCAYNCCMIQFVLSLQLWHVFVHPMLVVRFHKFNFIVCTCLDPTTMFIAWLKLLCWRLRIKKRINHLLLTGALSTCLFARLFSFDINDNWISLCHWSNHKFHGRGRKLYGGQWSSAW